MLRSDGYLQWKDLRSGSDYTEGTWSWGTAPDQLIFSWTRSYFVSAMDGNHFDDTINRREFAKIDIKIGMLTCNFLREDKVFFKYSNPVNETISNHEYERVAAFIAHGSLETLKSDEEIPYISDAISTSRAAMIRLIVGATDWDGTNFSPDHLGKQISAADKETYELLKVRFGD
ncbi:MAG: hypothetical protein JW904_02025 [Spirochaetales bacterium]|nr:hypothetical protein [Spirochaetales bacterium]